MQTVWRGFSHLVVDTGRLTRLMVHFGRKLMPLILLVAIYALAFLRTFPLLLWYKTAHASFAKMVVHSWQVAVALGFVGLGLVVLCRHMWATAIRQPGRFVTVLIVAGWLIASALLLFTYPGQSTDLGDYTFRAHMFAHLDKNPLTTRPHDIIPLEDFPYLAWHDTTHPYGPIWHWLAGSAHVLVGESLLANMLAFKVLAILATSVSGLLIYDILRRSRPGYAEAGLALWLWNPLVLNEGALHGHNDLVLVAIVLAGLWLVVRGHQTLGVIALVIAGLVKINAWIVVPVVAMWILRRQGWRQAFVTLAPAVLIGVLFVWLAYLPFGGWVRLAELARERGWWPTGTWTAAIFFFLRDRAGWSHEMTVKVVIGGATLVCAIIMIVLTLRIRDLLTGVWAVILAYLLAGCHWFQPWYVTWLVALAAIAGNRRLIVYMGVLTWFMLLHPIVSQFVVGPLDLPPWDYSLIMAALTLLIPQRMALRLIPPVTISKS